MTKSNFESHSKIALGLKENIFQFSLLVLVNSLVGGMIGLERSILPEIAEKEFSLVAKTAILSFIAVFGLTKAITNFFAGSLSDIWGRKSILIGGWLFSIPVPFLLMWAPTWNWILIANIFLGISQGLTWSTTVIMKIDLAGPNRRGLALGLNEFAGYFAAACSALATGYIASNFGLRPEPFYLGIVYVCLGIVLSIFLVKETKMHAIYEANRKRMVQNDKLTSRSVFLKTSFLDKNLSSISQAGFVNNLNDGIAWGLFPLLYANSNLGLSEIGLIAAVYPGTWSLAQLGTGYLSDKWGRKGLIVLGMFVQAVGILVTSLFANFWSFLFGSFLLGLGTAMVYPTLMAAIGDVANPSWRASSVGIYRFWRDIGYAVGAVVAGVIADQFGLVSATIFVAFITALSGLVVVIRMKETLTQQD